MFFVDLKSSTNKTFLLYQKLQSNLHALRGTYPNTIILKATVTYPPDASNVQAITRLLQERKESSNLKFLSTRKPTYWPSDRNQTLSTSASLKGITASPQQALSCFELSSDHSPIMITLSTQLKPVDPPSPPRLCNKLMNWELFRKDIESNLKVDVPFKFDIDIEEVIVQITKVIQYAGWNSTPKPAITFKDNAYLPVDITEKLADKRRLRRLWQTSRPPSRQKRLNRAARELKVLLSGHKKHRNSELSEKSICGRQHKLFSLESN